MPPAQRPPHYLRPIISLGVDVRRQDRQFTDPVSRLAGRPDLVFAHLELIDRSQESHRRCRLLPAFGEEGFENRDWFQEPFDGERMWALYERLIAVRPPFAGMAMDSARIMGIVNVTPDSFSDGGSFASTRAAIDHAVKLAQEGADILDIGGESTRPGSDAVGLEDEIKRVIPVIEGVRAKTTAKISVDTRKAEVMRRAAAAGADILNDVSALTHDPKALETAAEIGLPVMLMHAQGDPKTMNDNPQYDDVVLDVFDFLEDRIAACEAAGIARDNIVVDPGIGFGKHLHHNVAVLAAMSLYHGLGVPVLLGASRKKLIGQLSKTDGAKERVPGSLAAALSAVAQGVQIVRVHDVAATRQAVDVWQAAITGRETKHEVQGGG
ncbi:MAG TPA: dihydropteroate synthase [Hyphomicrobiaceae bacterium]|nr:dihydropteroate synthase [Hyphomicrobiaceae bacterium]